MSRGPASRALFAKANRALESAKLLEHADDCECACNRAYYAMFDAARGALLDLSGSAAAPSIKTHRGLIAAFGEQMVRKQGVPASLGAALNKVERLRLLADYTGDPITAEDAH